MTPGPENRERPGAIAERPAAAATLVLGPARSGKSEWAEWLAARSGRPVTYVATGVERPDDREWQARIAAHQRRRPAHWAVRCLPVDLAPAIAAAEPGNCWLVDSLGSWLANRLEEDDRAWAQTEAELLAALKSTRSQTIWVAEETGWGVVPAYPLGRRFRDRLGRLARNLGAIAGGVYLVTGGHALDLRKLGEPLPPGPPEG